MTEYTAEHVPAVRAFNSRMDQADAGAFRLDETPPNTDKSAHDAAFRHFLAVDHNGDVRGGYFIRSQPLSIRGQRCNGGQFAAPLSEGIIDKRFTGVGPTMLLHALKVQPILFSSGMGGLDQPLPRMMKSLGWHVAEVPFFFRVINGSRFLRNIGPLRKTLIRRLAADCLALSGLGGLGISLAQHLRTRAPQGSGFQSFPLTDFGRWADSVWRENQKDYLFAALRDADSLRVNYPRMTPPYCGVRLMNGDTTAGWINLLDCKPKNKSYFGEMNVTAIVDGVAGRPFIPDLILSAIRMAEENGADLIFSNQIHQDWTQALRNAGFWSGPSNYLVAFSPQLVRSLEPLTEVIPRIHFNRGDGDGRVNLLS